MTQWKLVSDDTESEPFDSREAAENEKGDLESLGATVELREVGSESESEDEPVDNSGDVDAEVIEMSVNGGNENGQDDDDEIDSLPEPRDELDSYRGWMSFCKTCGRFSREIYRCQFNDCGKDLTNEPNYRGVNL